MLHKDSKPSIFAALPLYQCHKQVRAFKINLIEQGKLNEPTQFTGGSYWLLSSPPDGQAVEVPDDYIQKYNPEVGGYFVAYDDGYMSYSPSGAFEGGYTQI